MTLLQCLWYLLRHKYYVALFGRTLGVSLWRLFVHDWSKLLPAQLEGYVDYYKNGQILTEKTFLSLQRHYRSERHHWNYFVSPIEHRVNADIRYICTPMGKDNAAEMVADWAAAGFAKWGRFDLREYYEAYKHSMILHAETQENVERFIELLYNDRELQNTLSAKAGRLRKRLPDR